MLQFGMPTLIENRTLEDNIALCKELGLSFVELNMNFPEYQIDKIEDIDWFYKKADEAGIYYTIHLDENMNIADFNPLVREAYLETVRRTIEVAKQFVALKNKYGKPQRPLIINMYMHHGIYITLPHKKVQMYDRDFDVYMDYILSFIKMCEKWIGESDIKIAIENTNGFREYEKKAIEKMLEISDSLNDGTTPVQYDFYASDKTKSFEKTVKVLLGDYNKDFEIEQVDIEKV